MRGYEGPPASRGLIPVFPGDVVGAGGWHIICIHICIFFQMENMCRLVYLLIWRAGGNCWDLPVSLQRGRDMCVPLPTAQRLHLPTVGPWAGSDGRCGMGVWGL